MNSHVFNVIFTLGLSLSQESVGADGNTPILMVVSNMRSRPALKMISPELHLFSTRPNSGGARLFSTAFYNSCCRPIPAVDTSVDCIDTTEDTSKFQNTTSERSSNIFNIGLSQCYYSLIQTVAGLFREYTVTGVSGIVSMIANSSVNLLKLIWPINLINLENFQSTHAGQLSYYRNITPRSREIEQDCKIILIMGEDPLAMELATYLYDTRSSTVSTLLMYHNSMLSVIRDWNFHLVQSSHVLMVGHSNKDRKGISKIGGYGPQEVARVVSTLEREKGHIQTIRFISCNLGNDLNFAKSLLQTLRYFNMETTLYMYSSLVSVTPNGEIVSTDNGMWRYHDGSNVVVVQLDGRGSLRRSVESSYRGQLIPDYNGKALYIQTLEWPSHPQMFVPEQLRRKYPSIDCLEGLTWSLFFEENERRRAPDYIPDDNQKHMTAVWLKEPENPAENMVFKHITNILDLLVEIRYNAREEVMSDLYYILNDCIYNVERTTLNVTLAGKFMNPADQDEVQNFLDNFNDQRDQSSLRELRLGLKPSKFNDFCRQTFQLRQCTYNCERWGHYFMAAVFSASVHNFHTYSLFLMSVIACEVGRLQGTESSVCVAFAGDDHPMASDEPWPLHPRRGFYGCSLDSLSLVFSRQESLAWLDKVVSKENALYIKSKQTMGNVDHDQQTELDIFGRVKVMNKYVFSSFLEFFRGTPEGKKLKRGCIIAPQENYN